MDKRIVITGAGVLASNGIGLRAFAGSLKNGVSGIKPVTLFDTSTTKSKLAGEISDFDPASILGKKGLRNLDRTTLLAMAASKLAIDDAGLSDPIGEDVTDQVGVSLGSTLGSVWSISEFDKVALREGPRATNPALFPNTVINSPASHISIRFNIKGFNATVSTGFCASLDAIFYALNQMELYGYHTVLAGGVEELCEQTYKGFHKIGYLAGSREGKEEVNCPFDKRRNGIILGEGAGIFVLEELEHALERKARVYAEITGYGTSFDPKSRNICSPKAEGASRAIKMALDDADIMPDDIGLIFSTANSTLDCDVMEARAIRKVFGDRTDTLPVTNIKPLVGETFSASGAMNIAAALVGTSEGFIPAIRCEVEKDKRCKLAYLTKVSDMPSGDILINDFGPTGNNSAIVMRGINAT
ncbi:MAG: beta-ketoacyl-[acyl-carrier-protein] synthase family protein [Candidatus Omnitrophica bacterium]|nr:beta-ketoacyl-[acyl-carrier-protein] synthase family protein [Candidatus Omnitrophota bacterium]MDD5487921.1 beta-ketoacyl-[acyl-carrier-protein] synthase family protein [Candidatus Omnitrophota bacterium]